MRLIPAFLLHVIKYAFAMLLLFFLNMVEGLTNVGILAFKNSCVIAAGNMFFCHQHILAESLVIVAALGQTKMALTETHTQIYAHLLALAALLLTLLHVGDLTLKNLAYGVVMGLLLLGMAVK